jgi:hypothetical protein
MDMVPLLWLQIMTSRLPGVSELTEQFAGSG